jgi:hypothetical protein
MDPHDPETAQRIVGDYAVLLEEHAKQDLYPGVITTLPYPRETIKTAIETSLAALAAARALTPELRDFLEVAYISLADYVDEEVARLLREFHKANAALAADSRPTRQKVASPAWSIVAESSALVSEIARAITEDIDQLRARFRELQAETAQEITHTVSHL